MFTGLEAVMISMLGGAVGALIVLILMRRGS